MEIFYNVISWLKINPNFLNFKLVLKFHSSLLLIFNTKLFPLTLNNFLLTIFVMFMFSLSPFVLYFLLKDFYSNQNHGIMYNPSRKKTFACSNLQKKRKCLGHVKKVFLKWWIKAFIVSDSCENCNKWSLGKITWKC